jgi:hypothetical protein
MAAYPIALTYAARWRRYSPSYSIDCVALEGIAPPFHDTFLETL